MGYSKPSSNVFEFIAERMDVKLYELLMVANNWSKDLEPLASKGGNTIWIKSEKYLPMIKKVLYQEEQKTEDFFRKIRL